MSMRDKYIEYKQKYSTFFDLLDYVKNNLRQSLYAQYLELIDIDIQSWAGYSYDVMKQAIKEYEIDSGLKHPLSSINSQEYDILLLEYKYFNMVEYIEYLRQGNEDQNIVYS